MDKARQMKEVKMTSKKEARIPKRMHSLPTTPTKGKTFVATVPNYWARGETLGSVLYNLRLYAGNIRFSDCSMVIMEVPENFQVHLITGAITWRGENADGRILFDSRTKAQRNFDDSTIACIPED